MESCNPTLTLKEERLKLVKDGSGDLVDLINFKRLVESLWYLIDTPLDIMYGVVGRFIETPR